MKDEFAETLVELNPSRPFLFRGLGCELPIVRFFGIHYLQMHLSKDSSRTFRVFDSNDGVSLMNFADFHSCLLTNRLAYLETSSVDERLGRGSHLLDSFPAAHLEPRPLAALFQDACLLKVRCYLRLENDSAPEMIVNWHYDGFDQVILNVTGERKFFDLHPPISDEHVSGWVKQPETALHQANITRVHLRSGDVFVLPARWCHRVVTDGGSFTVNWAFQPA